MRQGSVSTTHFPLNVSKTIQAIGVLFRSDGVSRMNYMRLLKLLYLADRESLHEIGRPITGGKAVAMPRGPVLEEVYELIRGLHQQMPLWDEYLRKDRYDLEMLKPPDTGKLSRYEIEKLIEVAKKYADDDEWALSGKTHKLKEWKKNNPGKSSKPIPLQDILDAVGRSAPNILDDAEEMSRIERLLGKK